VALFGLSGSPLNDLPHSIQDRFERGVIKPQNGHILWDPKSLDGRSAGVIHLFKPSAIKTKRLLSRLRNGTPEVFQSLTFVYSSHKHNWMQAVDSVQDCSHSIRSTGKSCRRFGRALRCEQFRSVILLRLSDHDPGDGHFCSLFQVF
jgi:hypothetical protein